MSMFSLSFNDSAKFELDVQCLPVAYAYQPPRSPFEGFILSGVILVSATDA